MHPPTVRHRAIIHYTHFFPSLRKVARLYGVGKSTLARWVKQSGPLSRTRSRHTLHQTICDTVEKAIRAQPFQSADALRQVVRGAHDVSVSRSTMYRSLRTLRLSYKRASRGREHEAVPAAHPFLHSPSYDGDVVAIDESSFYWNDYPRMGWGPKGKRVKKARPADRKRVSLLLAVGKEGVVAHTVMVGGVKSQHFADFVRSLPDGRPLLLDNCSIHKTKAVAELCRGKGCELRFTPPYCPWYNPVEFCFSEIKRRYRPMRLAATSRDFVADVLSCMRDLRHSEAYFRHAEAAWSKDRLAAGLPATPRPNAA